MQNSQSLETGTVVIAPRGVLRNDFTTNGATQELDLSDPPAGHIQQFAVNDLLRINALAFPDPETTTAAATIAHEFWSPAGLPMTAPCDVWLQVKSVSDEGAHFRYTVGQMSGPSCRFLEGTPVVGYGNEEDAHILLTSVRDSSPYVDIAQTGSTPWDGPVPMVRTGRLDGVAAVDAEQMGIAISSNLDDPSLAHIVASDQQLKLSRVDLTLDDGNTVSAQLSSDGSLQLGAIAGEIADEPDSSGLVFDAADNSLALAGDLQVGGGTMLRDDLAMINGELTTFGIASNGEFKVGSDVSRREQTGIHFDPEQGSLNFNAKLYQLGDVNIDGDLLFTDGDHATVSIKRSGEVLLGPDVLQEGGAQIHYDPAQQTLSVSAPLTTSGGISSEGAMTFLQEGKSTIRLEPSGALKLGSDTAQAETTAFEYRPDENIIAITTPLTLSGSTTSTGSLVFTQEDKRTLHLGADGTLQVGSDLDAEGGTALLYDPADGTVQVFAPLQVSGAALFFDTIELRTEDRVTVSLSPSGDLRLGNDVAQANGAGLHFDAASNRLTLAAELHLENDSFVGGDLLMQDDAALVAGSGESVRIDRDGIQMRLEPGENNSIKVVGVGRSALINAYQTPDSVQQLDVLAYYNKGVPSLHGSLLLGVGEASGGATDTFLRLTRYVTGARNIELNASYVNIQSDRIQLNGNTTARGNFDFSGTGGADRVFRLRNLPISPAGLPSGAVWNSGGTLKIVL